jgi:hypothetical protein
MPRSIDPAVSTVALAMAIDRVLPSQCTRKSAHETMYISGLDLRAWPYPCRDHTHGVTTMSVRLEASVAGEIGLRDPGNTVAPSP